MVEIAPGLASDSSVKKSWLLTSHIYQAEIDTKPDAVFYVQNQPHFRPGHVELCEWEFRGSPPGDFIPSKLGGDIPHQLAGYTMHRHIPSNLEGGLSLGWQGRWKARQFPGHEHRKRVNAGGHGVPADIPVTAIAVTGQRPKVHSKLGTLGVYQVSRS